MKVWKSLIAVFIILVILKIALASFVPTLSAYSDEYAYAKMAQSFFQDQVLTVHGQPFSVYPPLYSIVLSLSYAFSNISIIYFVMKLINALISTAIIFPVFYFARKFLDDKLSFVSALLVGVLPATFSFTPYLLSENLFYLVLFLSLFFLYEFFSKNKLSHAMLAGLFIGLSILTKFSALVLLFVPILLFIWQSFVKKRLQRVFINHGLILYGIALLVVGIWLFRNGLLFGFSLQGVFGNAVSRNLSESLALSKIIVPFISWIVLYSGYLLLASGILFGLLSFGLIKDHFWKNSHEGLFVRLFILSAGLFVLVAANHSSTFPVLYNSPFSFVTYRPIGRYIEGFLPLIILMGLIAFQNLKDKLSNGIIFFGALLAGISSLLTLAPLFPSNNPSLSWLGGITFLLKSFSSVSLYDFSWKVFIVIFVLLVFLTIIMKLITSLGIRKVSTLFLVFFLLVSFTSFIVTYNQSLKWDSRYDIVAVKEYFPELDGPVLFDQESCGTISLDSDVICENISTVSGFWITEDITIGDPNDFGDARYIISTRDLNFAGLVKYNGFVLYKTFL